MKTPNSFLSLSTIRLYIQEEYGFGHYLAVLTSAEYRELIRRWETMRGLNCQVPVQWIVPQARRLDWPPPVGAFDASCHIHESEDSYLEGSVYRIPDSEDGRFWIDGEAYGTLESFSECPDVLLSSDLPLADVERALAEAWPGFKVVLDFGETERLLAASGVAVLTRRNDPNWAASLHFPWLPLQPDLETLPHLAIARRLADVLGIRTLTDASEVFNAPDPLSIGGEVVMRADGEWFQVDIVPGAADSRIELQIVGRIEDFPF